MFFVSSIVLSVSFIILLICFYNGGVKDGSRTCIEMIESYKKLISDYKGRLSESISLAESFCKNYEEVQKNYNELIESVKRTFPDETKHQTIIRYITEAEDRNDTK